MKIRVNAKTKEIKEYLQANRILVKDLGTDLFPESDYYAAQSRVSYLINNKFKKVSVYVIKKLSFILGVSPKDIFEIVEN